jgi:hypothetical protein
MAPLSRSLLTSTVLLISGCDVVTSRYDTLADAKADPLWLPDILPPSARNIRTSNNLDLNTSEGEFYFEPEEFALMEAQLQPFSNPPHPFTRRFKRRVNRHADAGNPLYQFTEGDTTWIFFCKPARGECEYTMWLRRSDAGGTQ